MSNRLINASLAYTVGSILIKGMSFLTIPLYTRLMTTGDYGVYNTFAAYTSVLTFFVSLGLDPTLKNAHYDYRGKENSYLSTVYLLMLGCASLVLAACILWGGTLGRLLFMSRPLLVLMVISATVSATINIYNIKLSLQYKSRSYLRIALFNAAVGIGASVLLMLTVLREERYLGRVIGSLLPGMMVAGVIIFHHVFRVSPRFNAGMARYALQLGLPLIPHLISQVISSQFDRIMIARMVGFSEAGIYSFTYNIAVILQIVYQSMENVWSPWIFQQLSEGHFDRLQRVSRKYVLVVAILAMGLITISKEFIAVFAAAAYWDGQTLAPVLIAGIYFLFLYTIPAGVEYYYKKTKYIALGSILTAMLNIALNLLAIGRFGYQAAAYTTLLSYMVLFAMHWQIYRRLRPMKLFDFRYIMLCTIAVLAWSGLNMVCTGMPFIRYGGFAVFLCGAIWHLRAELWRYLTNLNRR